MVDYLKSFQNISEYDTYKSSSGFVTPNVSLMEDTWKTKQIVHVPDPFNGYEYVDMGLPSGILWAKCNVGAATETDYGDYFMWGDPEPATDKVCIWGNYKYASGNSNSSKYNATDGLTVLELSDDMARVNMKGAWRTPTSGEFDELLNTGNTTTTWVTDYQGSGHNGRLYTSKINGNTLFFPEAGNRWYDFTDDAFSGCWTSSYGGSQYKTAIHFYFGDSYGYLSYNSRSLGLSVRGVIQLS